MENKTKSIIASTLLAGALFATTTSNANPFHYNNLGTGEEVRTNLLGQQNRGFELSCGAKSKTDSTTTAKKGKDGKCGEGKCGEKKADKKSTAKNTKKKGS